MIYPFFRYLSNSSDNGKYELFSCANLSIVNARLVQSIFELRLTIVWVFQEAIVNSNKILFSTSFPRVVEREMFFLCLSFAVPSTTRSSHSDDDVRD